MQHVLFILFPTYLKWISCQLLSQAWLSAPEKVLTVTSMLTLSYDVLCNTEPSCFKLAETLKSETTELWNLQWGTGKMVFLSSMFLFSWWLAPLIRLGCGSALWPWFFSTPHAASCISCWGPAGSVPLPSVLPSVQPSTVWPAAGHPGHDTLPWTGSTSALQTHSVVGVLHYFSFSRITPSSFLFSILKSPCTQCCKVEPEW